MNEIKATNGIEESTQIIPSQKTRINPDENNTTQKCLIVISDDNMNWELNKKFHRLGGVEDFTGWHLSIEHKGAVKEICESAGLFYGELPILSDFEELKKNITSQMLLRRQEDIAPKITNLANKLGFKWNHKNLDSIDFFYEKSIQTELEKTGDGLKLRKLIYIYKDLQEKIEQCSIIKLLSNIDTNTESEKSTIAKQVLTANHLLENQEQRLSKYRGKEFIGICQKTLPTLDNYLLGLRKFILLAAAPNIGKTALTIQLGIDIVNNNEKTCLLYVSLEMSREDIIDRMRCYLTPMTYKKLYFGSIKENNNKGWYTEDEENDLSASKNKLETIGNRILILDDECCPNITIDTILSHAHELKNKTDCQSIIVIIDYLQVLPIPETMKLRSDNDADRYRLDQIKKLRIALGNDPLIVISEARKPSSAGKWASSIADILGSVRTAYNIDAGLLLNTLSDEELAEGLEPKTTEKDRKYANIRKTLADKGIAIVEMTIDKGRDGMQKGTILLEYYFQENRFAETSWDKIKKAYDGVPSDSPNDAAQKLPAEVERNYPSMSKVQQSTSQQTSLMNSNNRTTNGSVSQEQIREIVKSTKR